jgi:hypothetical protein
MAEEAFESNGTAEAAYRDRSLVAQLCAKLAEQAGFNVSLDVTDPQWPILFIDFLDGQISYHLALNDLAHWTSELPRAPIGHWDGHSVEEKQRRICRMLNHLTPARSP